MAMDRSKYSADWDAISLRIRARDHWHCKFCGAENRKPHPKTGSMVVLTVAHLDHDTQNNADENLASLCQKCHLTYDGPHHAANAKKTRQKKKAQAIRESGQEALF